MRILLALAFAAGSLAAQPSAPQVAGALPPVRTLGKKIASSTELLGAVSQARALPGGRVLVNDNLGRKVVLFDPTLQSYTIVADTTVPFFKDPVTGRVQINPTAGRTVYLAWNTLVGAIGSANTTSIVNLTTSTDGGQTFSGALRVNNNFVYDPPPDRVFHTHDSAPSVAVTMPPKMPPRMMMGSVSAQNAFLKARPSSLHWKICSTGQL